MACGKDFKIFFVKKNKKLLKCKISIETHRKEQQQSNTKTQTPLQMIKNKIMR